MADISVKLAGLTLRNPTVLASGIMGVSLGSIRRAIEAGAGAAVIKSITKKPRAGHPNPAVIGNDKYLLNAIGYSNPGAEEARKEFSALKELDAPVFASVTGSDAKDFVEAINVLCEGTCFAGLEIPLSCPHTPGFGTMAGQGSPEKTFEIVSAVRAATKLPLFVKLSPNVGALGRVAKAAEEAGADGITMGNSLGPGMRIDPVSKKPVLGFGFGGVTGPAIFPIALRCVYDVYKAVDIPVMGCGGVSSGRDALEMAMAGASAVQVGSAVLYHGPEVFRNIADEIREWLDENNYSSFEEIIGAAHE